jgi:hypothetical protein
MCKKRTKVVGVANAESGKLKFSRVGTVWSAAIHTVLNRAKAVAPAITDRRVLLYGRYHIGDVLDTSFHDKGVEPASPYGQPILGPMKPLLRNLTKQYKPIFIGLAVVKVSLRLASYQHVAPPS